MKKKYADMDPLEEIRAIREELHREFPSVDALFDYVQQRVPAKKQAPEPPRKDRRASTKTKANVRSTVHQRKLMPHA